MPSKRVVALFSGGLDSILSVKWMHKLGFTVIPVFFSAPYFPSAKAALSAQDNDIDLRIIDISKKHLEMLKNPRYGYGKNFNPCIDCHAQMIQFAGDLLAEYDASFIITGEVLGQRPMSQNRKSLQIVSEISSYGDLLVRPLCQQHLPDTLPIREQWVDKNDLLSFSGRSRKPQIQLAKELDITLYPTPGGGCLLTNVNYSLRLADLLQYSEGTNRELELLKYGRHFRLSNQLKLVLGRFDTENEVLYEGFPGSVLIRAKDSLGPWGILEGDITDPDTIQLAANIVLSYTNKASYEEAVCYGKDFEYTINAHKVPRESLRQYIITEDKEL